MVSTGVLVDGEVEGAERDVGGATVTVVKTMAGRVVPGRAGVLRVAGRGAGAGRPAGVLAVVDAAVVDAGVGTTGVAGVDSGMPRSAGDDAPCTEMTAGASSLSGGTPLTEDSEDDTAVPGGVADADDCRALLPMMSTMPISTPTVTLRAAAVSTTAAFPGTAPSPQRADGSIAPITVAHRYLFFVPRRSRPIDPPGRPGRRPATGSGWQQAQSTRDGEFLVRTVPGAQAQKTYRCPGCQQVIASGTAHLVVWPEWTGDDEGGVAQRRHWHTGCWQRRAARGGPALPW